MAEFSMTTYVHGEGLSPFWDDQLFPANPNPQQMTFKLIYGDRLKV